MRQANPTPRVRHADRLRDHTVPAQAAGARHEGSTRARTVKGRRECPGAIHAYGTHPVCTYITSHPVRTAPCCRTALASSKPPHGTPPDSTRLNPARAIAACTRVDVRYDALGSHPGCSRTFCFVERRVFERGVRKLARSSFQHRSSPTEADTRQFEWSAQWGHAPRCGLTTLLSVRPA